MILDRYKRSKIFTEFNNEQQKKYFDFKQKKFIFDKKKLVDEI